MAGALSYPAPRRRSSGVEARDAAHWVDDNARRCTARESGSRLAIPDACAESRRTAPPRHRRHATGAAILLPSGHARRLEGLAGINCQQYMLERHPACRRWRCLVVVLRAQSRHFASLLMDLLRTHRTSVWKLQSSLRQGTKALSQ